MEGKQKSQLKEQALYSDPEKRLNDFVLKCCK